MRFEEKKEMRPGLLKQRVSVAVRSSEPSQNMVSSGQLPVRLSQPLLETSSLKRTHILSSKPLPETCPLEPLSLFARPDSDQFARVNLYSLEQTLPECYLHEWILQFARANCTEFLGCIQTWSKGCFKVQWGWLGAPIWCEGIRGVIGKLIWKRTPILEIYWG